MTIRSYIAALGAILTFASCSDDNYPDPGKNPGTGIASDIICFGTSTATQTDGSRAGDSKSAPVDAGRFVLRATDGGTDTLCVAMTVTDFDDTSSPTPLSTVSTDNGRNSRAALTTGFGDMPEAFGVCGYMTPVSNENWTTYFSNEKNNKPAASGDPWIYDRTDITYYWPGADFKMRFFAYAPYDDGTGYITFAPGATSADDPRITLYVDKEISKHTDLLVATATDVPGNNNAAVPLTFSHACTAVQFVIGSEMQPGSIKSITIKGAYNKGTYANGAWTPDTNQKGECTQTFGADGHPTTSATTDADGNPLTITNDSDCMIMLPQTLPDGAAMEVVFTDKLTGTDRTLTAPLAGQTWPVGKRIKYRLSITPTNDFKLEFNPDDNSTVIDAHYVICKGTLSVSNIAPDVKWTVTAPDFGSEHATIQLQSEMNEFAKDGFWTDKITRVNGAVESARGNPQITGTGSYSAPVAIFIPENASLNPRDLEFEISFDDYPQNATSFTLLTQLCPAWTASGFGWEQVEESPLSEYGFCWDYTVYYGYLYSYIGIIKKNRYTNYLNTLINSNGAASYAFLHEFQHHSVVDDKRLSIKIEYGRLNNLIDVADNTSDGWTNTTKLYNFGGKAATRAFEKIIKLTKKTENTKETEDAFRIGDGTYNEAPAPTGNKQPDDNIAVGDIIKKNKYNLKEAISEEGDKTTETVLTDIVWYLPAHEQFDIEPTNSIHEAIDKGNTWSSTAINDATNDKAYLGSHTPEQRNTKHRVRACRKPL